MVFRGPLQRKKHHVDGGKRAAGNTGRGESLLTNLGPEKLGKRQRKPKPGRPAGKKQQYHCWTLGHAHKGNEHEKKRYGRRGARVFRGPDIFALGNWVGFLGREIPGKGGP